MDKIELMNDLNKIMDKYGLTLADVATKVSISFMTAYRWKHGLSAPKSRLILQAYQSFIKEFPV
jgi:transcriptional regulator with XRE-family HTH domain